jgi:hypothetical protein
MGDEGEKQVEIWKVKRVSTMPAAPGGCSMVERGADACLLMCSSSKLWSRPGAMEPP